MNPKILEVLDAHLDLIGLIKTDEKIVSLIEDIVDLITKAFQNNQKVLICGNGGSAADAEHIAAELSGRFYMDRPALFAEALNVNGAALTAISNDYGYDHVFARILESKGQQGDILIVLTTSGNSPNIHKAIEKAREMDVRIIAITGNSNNPSLGRSDIHLKIPSEDTPRIQEATLLIGHIMCELIEANLFTT